MAPTTLLAIALAFAFSFSLHASLGTKIDCENLNGSSCAYAVSSAGKRCVLENRALTNGYTCRTSEIVADRLSGLIETEECITACRVNRKDLGISSDSLMEHSFVEGLCSDKCYSGCPNIVDLFFTLAAGEGVYLPKFCQARKSSGRREAMELNSGGDGTRVASAPAQAVAFDAAASPVGSNRQINAKMKSNLKARRQLLGG